MLAATVFSTRGGEFGGVVLFPRFFDRSAVNLCTINRSSIPSGDLFILGRNRFLFIREVYISSFNDVNDDECRYIFQIEAISHPRRIRRPFICEGPPP